MATDLIKQVALAGLLGAGLVTGALQASQPRTALGGLVAAAGLNPECAIKGNVSINSGERIYHVPGQMFYADTVIDNGYGERWFCSEAEARQAGWRKARR